MGKDREKKEVESSNSKVSKIAVAFLALFLIVTLSAPIWDNDFWWHIATGKDILANGRIPETDNFTFASEYSPERHELLESSVTLKGNWLAQVIFYAIFKYTGPYGIIALRIFLFLSIFFLIFRWAKNYQCNNFVILLLLFIAGQTSSHFTGDRPQLFSFLFSVIMVYFLDQFSNIQESKKQYKFFLILPPIMILWANSHRGFVLGSALLTVYFATELFRIILSKKDKSKNYLLRLTVLIILTVLASLINPNTYKAYLFVFKLEGSALQKGMSEYISPIKLGLAIASYWIYVAISISAIAVGVKKANPIHISLTIFLFLISLSAFRYIPFLIFITIPFVSIQLTRIINNNRGISAILSRYGMPCLIILILGVSFFNCKGKLFASIKDPVEKFRFPVRAASFIKNAHPKGNLFNHFNWGGYLIWRLYPEHKVFVDGRTLNLRALTDYTYMLWDIPEAPILLDHYKITIIAMPATSPRTGEFYTILNYLAMSDQWHLVYYDETSVVFLRGIENAQLTEKFSIPKNKAYRHVIMLGEDMQRRR